MNPVEDGSKLTLDFKKLGKLSDARQAVLPVTVQDVATGEVLLLAYTNEEAFRRAIETRSLVLWSTSRNALWEKGKTSGNTFALVDVYVNCEQNSLLYKVRPRQTGMCHTVNRSRQARTTCFYRRLNLDTFDLENQDP